MTPVPDKREAVARTIWQALQPFMQELEAQGSVTFMGLRNAVTDAILATHIAPLQADLNKLAAENEGLRASEQRHLIQIEGLKSTIREWTTTYAASWRRAEQAEARASAASAAARETQKTVERLTTLRSLDDYHEDQGFVLWWKLPIEEPPYCGSPNCDDWPGYHTHWSPLPDVREPALGTTDTDRLGAAKTVEAK